MALSPSPGSSDKSSDRLEDLSVLSTSSDRPLDRLSPGVALLSAVVLTATLGLLPPEALAKPSASGKLDTSTPSSLVCRIPGPSISNYFVYDRKLATAIAQCPPVLRDAILSSQAGNGYIAHGDHDKLQNMINDAQAAFRELGGLPPYIQSIIITSDVWQYHKDEGSFRKLQSLLKFTSGQYDAYSTEGIPSITIGENLRKYWNSSKQK